MHAHMDYVHFHPVKQGLVNRTVDWPYSICFKRVEAGIYSPDWASGMAETLGYGDRHSAQ